MRPLNPEVFFKKLREPLDDRFLLFRAVAAAKAGDRRQDLVNIRAGRFERTVAERVGDEALRFCGLQLFFCDDLLQLLLFLLLHIPLPVALTVLIKPWIRSFLLRSWMLPLLNRICCLFLLDLRYR